MLYGFSEYRDPQHRVMSGGKGSVLARLFQDGYPVPDGFIIAANAFDTAGIKSLHRQEAVERFTRMIEGGTESVAVRSSALAEDSASASFAGEFASVLSVSSVTEFEQAIQSVFDSASSDRVKRYSQNVGVATEHRIAIVVQAMVAADFAGVLFTVEPVSQDHNVLAGNFVEGLGEQLVSGNVPAYTFQVDRHTGAYNGAPHLAPYADKLTKVALEIEADLGEPQDIEWATSGGAVFILQSRPITTLSKRTEVWNSTASGDYLWTSTNVGEALGGVMTPYTWSVMRRTFETYYEPPPGHCTVGNVAGRIYFNLSPILGAMRRLGVSPQRVLSLGEGMFGIVPADLSLPVPDIPFFQAAAWMWRLNAKSIRGRLSQKRLLDWARTESPQRCLALADRVAQITTLDDALTLIDELKGASDRDFATLIQVTLDFAVKREWFRSRLAKHMDADDVETLVSGLGGHEGLQSMGPMIAVEKLSRGEISREDFIKTYGHRGPNEVELAQPRTGEDPDWIDKLIEQTTALDTPALIEKQRLVREEAWSHLEAKVSPRRFRRLRRMSGAAALAGQARELVRSELVRFMAIPRQLALKIGELTGLCDDVFYLEHEEVEQLLGGMPRDDEKISIRKATFEHYKKLPAPPNLISGTFDTETWAHNPNRRTDFFDAHNDHQFRDESAIRGCPGAAGTVEGSVRVLANHHEASLLEPGEILVASFTNVGWTPIFPKAAAVITDVGAPLSHAAIVARELGIPAVVGTGNATMLLKTGDRVRVNGSAGIVERL